MLGYVNFAIQKGDFGSVFLYMFTQFPNTMTKTLIYLQANLQDLLDQYSMRIYKNWNTDIDSK